MKLCPVVVEDIFVSDNRNVHASSIYTNLKLNGFNDERICLVTCNLNRREGRPVRLTIVLYFLTCWFRLDVYSSGIEALMGSLGLRRWLFWPRPDNVVFLFFTYSSCVVVSYCFRKQVNLQYYLLFVCTLTRRWKKILSLIITRSFNFLRKTWEAKNTQTSTQMKENHRFFWTGNLLCLATTIAMSQVFSDMFC